MIQVTRGFLAGKKTYALSIVTIALTWLGFALGEPVLGHDAATVGDAVQMTITALLAITFRAGMDNTVKKAVSGTDPEPAPPPAPQVVDVEVVKDAMAKFVAALEKKSVDAPSPPAAPVVENRTGLPPKA